MNRPSYCKLKIFRKNLNFTNSVKREFFHIKNSPLGHDLPILVKDTMISPFREGFMFMKLRLCEVSRK